MNIMSIIQNDTIYLISTLVLSIPLIWGVYEFRKFRFQLDDIKDKANKIDKKIEDITSNKLDNYPLLLDFKEVVDKVNKVFKP
jgi:hypothetical protein